MNTNAVRDSPHHPVQQNITPKIYLYSSNSTADDVYIGENPD